MGYTSFAFSVEDHIANIRLNRPEKRNCMIREFWTEMVEVFAEIEDRPEVRAVVISADGPVFTAGIDLGMFAGIAADMELEDGRRREKLRRLVLDMQESFNVIVKSRVPVLAAIQGGCFGGGIDMTTACDMRYCTEDAYFVVKEIDLGMTADVGTLQRLPRVIPNGLARELAYTGREMKAEEALRSGFVNAVYKDHATMLEEVFAIAKRIAGHSPLAITGSKEMINYVEDHSVEDGLNYIATWQAGMFAGTRDLMEAFQASQEKRAPSFEDLAPATEMRLAQRGVDIKKRAAE